MSLCPEAEYRASLSDGEFWQHVFFGDDGPDDPLDHWLEAYPPDITQYLLVPCETCGEAGPCAYDSQGLPLYHAALEGEVT